MPRRKKGNQQEEIVNRAIEEGVSAIVEHHPGFRGKENYIARHLNKGRIQHGIAQIQEVIDEKGKDWDEQTRAQVMYQNLANYVASGGAFDDSAKEVILNGSLEEKAEGIKTPRGRGREQVGVDNVTEAFTDIYQLMRSGDYAERMPELAEAAGTIYDMGFLNTTVKVLKSRGLLNEGQYKALNSAIEERRAEAGAAISHYITSKKKKQRIAASIVGIAGLGVALLSKGAITGNVTGASSTSAIGGLIGVGLLVVSLILFSKSS